MSSSVSCRQRKYPNLIKSVDAFEGGYTSAVIKFEGRLKWKAAVSTAVFLSSKLFLIVRVMIS